MSNKHIITKTVIGTVIGHYIYDHRESIGKTLSAVGEAVTKAIEKALVAQQLEKLKAMDFAKGCGDHCDHDEAPLQEGEVSFGDFMSMLASQMQAEG